MSRTCLQPARVWSPNPKRDCLQLWMSEERRQVGARVAYRLVDGAHGYRGGLLDEIYLSRCAQFLPFRAELQLTCIVPQATRSKSVREHDCEAYKYFGLC